MTLEKKSLSPQEWVGLVLATAILLGGIVRFFPGWMAGFPLNDGGMFLSMVLDLKQSQYVLPKFTSYNNLNIPFAYPPFGFYFSRVTSDVLGVSELVLLRWIPPFVHALSIIAFYFFVSELLRSKHVAALASAFYALTPGAYGWFVMGGGLTRSFGALFLLLTAYKAFQLFQLGRKKDFGWAILFGGLTVLSHPEAGIHAAAACILLWLFYGRTLKSLINAMYVGLGVLLLSFPWWGAVLVYHGVQPFYSALHTGSHGSSLLAAIGALIRGNELLFFMPLLRVLAFGWALGTKRYFLAVWVILPYLLEPRSAPSVAFYPLTILIALVVVEIGTYLIQKARRLQFDSQDLFQNNLFNFSIFLVFIYLFVESGLYGFRLVGNSLKPDEIEAMHWVRENISADAVFLFVTGIPSPEIDPYVEWFPALTGSQNQTTIQGYEWLLAEEFYKRYSDLSELQQCRSIECIEKLSAQMNLTHEYIIFSKDETDPNVFESLNTDADYEQLFANDAILIYKK